MQIKILFPFCCCLVQFIQIQAYQVQTLIFNFSLIPLSWRHTCFYSSLYGVKVIKGVCFFPWLSFPDFTAPLKASKLFGRALKMSADFTLCGSVADLDTACCNMPSSKQLTNVAAAVSVMAVERGGRLDGAELWMHSGCLSSGSEGECGVCVCWDC